MRQAQLGGVGHDQVETPEALDDAPHDRGDRAAVAGVGGELAIATGRGGDQPAVGSEALHERSAEAARRPGDEEDAHWITRPPFGE